METQIEKKQGEENFTITIVITGGLMLGFLDSDRDLLPRWEGSAIYTSNRYRIRGGIPTQLEYLKSSS